MPRSSFPYVELFRPPQKWRRVNLSDVDEELKQSPKDLFVTVQRFASAVATGSIEEHIAPIYFDFDSDQDAGLSLEDARLVLGFITGLSVPHKFIRAYFSGNRGFHLTVEHEVFGIQPDRLTTYTIKQFCFWVASKLTLKTFDSRIYSWKRQWRLPNSIHAKTGLYCIEIPLDALAKYDIATIRELAKKPQQLLHGEDEYEDVEPVEHLVDMWQEFFVEAKSLYELEDVAKNQVAIPSDGYPECVKDLLENSIRKEGDRNKATVILASALKDMGLDAARATRICADFASRIPAALSHADPKERADNVRSVVRSVYSGKYHFSCAYIRSLSSEESKISCNEDDCPIGARSKEVIQDVTLDGSVAASLAGRLVRFEAFVSGKNTTPFLVPKTIRTHCAGEGNKCGICRLSEKQELTSILKPDDERLLAFIIVSDQQRAGFIKKASGIPSLCHDSSFEVVDYYTAWDLALTPTFTFSLDTIFSKQEYVVRRAIFVGDAPEMNAEYRFVARLASDPKTQAAMLLCFSSEKLKNDLDTPEENADDLKIFSSDPTVRACTGKLLELYDDLSNNALKIYGRFELFLAYHLAFCSAIGFEFDGTVVKGWMDILVIGDTAQGKTWMLERMMSHYRAGTIVSGETAKRTGLVFSWQQQGANWMLIWGVLPKNDRRLVAIDEFHELDEAEIRNMSRLRASGIAEATGVVVAKTPARTRLIAVSNPKSAHTDMASLNYGVLGIGQVFPQKEDIRRLDYAVAVASGEVSKEVLAQRSTTTPHIFTTDLCARLIHFAWTRSPSDILFTAEAVAQALKGVSTILSRFSPKVPLVEPGDLRYKIARIAVATAIATYSVNADGKVEVKAYHCEFAVNFLVTIYSTDAMGYDVYSSMITDGELSLNEEDEVLSAITDSLPSDISAQRFATMLLSTPAFRKKELDELLGMGSTGGLDRVIKILAKYSLIKTTRNGFVKSPTFIKLLKKMMRVNPRPLPQNHDEPEPEPEPEEFDYGDR